VEPRTSQEVANILREAAAQGATVQPVGSGTDIWPTDGEGERILLSTRELAGMETYEPADLTFTAGAGTTLASLADALGPQPDWAARWVPATGWCAIRSWA
jgi:glycolate oxidase FAD binding subunit